MRTVWVQGKVLGMIVVLLALPAWASAAGLTDTAGLADCSVKPVTDSYFAARSKVLKFPGGRELTVIGLNHGNRDLHGGSIDTLSKARSPGEVSHLVATNLAAVADAREALRFLRANAGRFQFMAAEASPATVAVNKKSYADLKVRVARLGPQADEAMMLAFGADFYFFLFGPRAPRLMGVEDSALGDTYLRSLPAMEKSFARLKAAQFDADTAARLSDFLNSLAARYATFRPESDDSLRVARAKFTAQNFAVIEPFLRARLDVMRAMKARDRHDAEQLLAQKQSGVLLIGSAHLDSIASMLYDACVSSAVK